MHDAVNYSCVAVDVDDPLDHLGDFTTTTRVLPIAGLAIVIGVCRRVRRAPALLELIGFFTNLFFFQRCQRRRVVAGRPSSRSVA